MKDKRAEKIDRTIKRIEHILINHAWIKLAFGPSGGFKFRFYYNQKNFSFRLAERARTEEYKKNGSFLLCYKGDEDVEHKCIYLIDIKDTNLKIKALRALRNDIKYTLNMICRFYKDIVEKTTKRINRGLKL